MKLKSLDLSSFAHVKRVPVKRWEYRGKRGPKSKKSEVYNIAIIKPRPGKGFEFDGAIYPKMAELFPILKEKGFHAYRQGGERFKKNGAVNPTVAVA